MELKKSSLKKPCDPWISIANDKTANLCYTHRLRRQASVVEIEMMRLPASKEFAGQNLLYEGLSVIQVAHLYVAFLERFETGSGWARARTRARRATGRRAASALSLQIRTGSRGRQTPSIETLGLQRVHARTAVLAVGAAGVGGR